MDKNEEIYFVRTIIIIYLVVWKVSTEFERKLKCKRFKFWSAFNLLQSSHSVLQPFCISQTTSKFHSTKFFQIFQKEKKIVWFLILMKEKKRSFFPSKKFCNNRYRLKKSCKNSGKYFKWYKTSQLNSNIFRFSFCTFFLNNWC